jgi:phosphatidylserine decarboxylase
VLYLGPGDYHRIHSPSNWQIYHRRHFAGKLYPVNNRAVRTIKNLYVVNERVVLEGKWSQGLMAMAAVGATNVGSIEVFHFSPNIAVSCLSVDVIVAVIQWF